MSRKPLLVLSVASLFVALTLTAVGLGWGEHVEDLPAGTPLRVAALAPDSSVNDPEGDLVELRMLQPFPYTGRDVTIEGNTAKVLVPRWVLGDLRSFQWLALTFEPVQRVRLDVAPDNKVLNWTRGALSEAPDVQNPELLPYEDLTYVRLREVASSRLEFLWRCRGDIPNSAADFWYVALVGSNFLVGPDYMVALVPTGTGWSWSVSTLADTTFPWRSTSYEDILSAAVSQAGDGQLTFEMTMALDIPAVPPDEDGYPWFTWVLDVDRDQMPGGASDVNVVVRWNGESGQWEGALRGWTGQHYEDLDTPVNITHSGAMVSATVSVADLGLDGAFLWLVKTSVNVGPADEQFFGYADHAPDSGWVEEATSVPTLTPTATLLEPSSTPTLTATPPGGQRIYLPVITRSVMF